MIINIKGYNIIIDDEDYKLINSKHWQIIRTNSNKGVYFQSYNSYKNGKKIFDTMHRYILGLSTGDNIIVDHINRDILDNRKSNLRLCTISQNGMNRKVSKNNSIGLKNVHYDKLIKKWISRISSNGKRIVLGKFNCPTVAWLAYCKAAKELHGEFARFS